MKTKILLATLSLATSLAGIARADQLQLASSMKEVRLELGNTRDQLGSTISALNTLTHQEKGDLRPAYDAFIAEIPKTEAAADVTRKRLSWMQGDGLKYFDQWQLTIESINNADLREKSQDRLDDTKKNYTKVMAKVREAGDQFKPFLADLNDIQKVLVHDLTAGGIKGMRSTVKDANSKYKDILETFNDALEEMQKLEKSLSVEAK